MRTLRRKNFWLVGGLTALAFVGGAVYINTKNKDASAMEPSITAPYSLDWSKCYNTDGTINSNCHNYYTNDFTINNHRAWCLDANKDTPNKDSDTSTSAIDPYSASAMTVLDYPSTDQETVWLFRAMYFGTNNVRPAGSTATSGYSDVAIHTVVDAIRHRSGTPTVPDGYTNSKELLTVVLDTNDYKIPEGVVGHVYILHTGATQEMTTFDYEVTEVYHSVSVHKSWIDANRDDRPTVVYVDAVDRGDHSVIYASHLELSASTGWTASTGNVVPNGHKVDFIESPEQGYTVEQICNAAEDSCVLRNTYHGTTRAVIKKRWNDYGYEQNRPQSISFLVVGTKGNTEVYRKTKTLTDANKINSHEWDYVLDDLPGVDGNEVLHLEITETINYAESAPITYHYAFSGDTEMDLSADNLSDDFVTTNRLEKITVPVHKVWDDEGIDQDRPRAVRLVVYSSLNGSTPELQGAYTLTCTNTSDCSEWDTNLTFPKSDKNGDEYNYTFTEVEVPYYKTTYVNNDNDGFSVTNSRPLVNISIEKIWTDRDDAFGERPTEVAFVARKSHQKYVSFPGPGGYQPTGYVTDQLPLTEEQGGTNGEAIVRATNATAVAGDYCYGKSWCFEVKNLPKYDEHGYEIIYDFFEVPIETYAVNSRVRYNGGRVTLDTDSSDDMHYHYTASNTGTTSLKVIKCWDDENLEGYRPEKITFIVNQKSTLVDNDYEIEVTADDEDSTGCWSRMIYTLPDSESNYPSLPLYDLEGNPITYSVKEDETAFVGDTVYVPSSSNCIFSQTNNFTCGFVNYRLINITVKKVWVGDDEEDRPKEVKVTLKSDGKAYGKSVTLNEKNKWTYTWDSLDYDHEWTLTEDIEVEGYEKADIVYEEDENGNLMIYVYNVKGPDTLGVRISKYVLVISGITIGGYVASKKIFGRH